MGRRRRAILGLAALAGALGGGGCLPLLVPVSPTAERAITTAIGAAGSSATQPLVKPPPRPCQDRHARPSPDAPCQPIPCGGRCGPEQRCDETALVPVCVPQ